MTTQEFDAILESRITKIRETSKSKAKEYAHGDRLSTFNRAAVMQGISREKALIGMWSKHVVSILDIVDEMDKGIMPTPAMIDEKIGDTTVYMILLEAMILEDLCERIYDFLDNNVEQRISDSLRRAEQQGFDVLA